MRQGWASGRAERLMRTTIQVVRTTTTDDGQGGAIAGSPTVIATVAGDIRPIGQTPQEQAIADSLVGRSLWTIGLPVGTDVESADQLVEVGSGRTFEVVKPLVFTLAVELPVVCIER